MTYSPDWGGVRAGIITFNIDIGEDNLELFDDGQLLGTIGQEVIRQDCEIVGYSFMGANTGIVRCEIKKGSIGSFPLTSSDIITPVSDLVWSVADNTGTAISTGDITPSIQASSSSNDGSIVTGDTIFPSGGYQYNFDTTRRLREIELTYSQTVGEFMTGSIDFYYIPKGVTSQVNFVLMGSHTILNSNLSHEVTSMEMDTYRWERCDGGYIYVNGSIEGGSGILEEAKFYEYVDSDVYNGETESDLTGWQDTSLSAGEVLVFSILPTSSIGCCKFSLQLLLEYI